MDLLAHNGVNHDTALDAGAHIASDAIIRIALMSLVVIGLIIVTVWTINKLAGETYISTPEDKEK